MKDKLYSYNELLTVCQQVADQVHGSAVSNIWIEEIINNFINPEIKDSDGPNYYADVEDDDDWGFNEDDDEYIFAKDEVKEWVRKMKSLPKDYWKKALSGKLTYEEEYLCLMQYGAIQSKNAEDARKAGKGTFGYLYRGVTEEEYKGMAEVYYNNLAQYMKMMKEDPKMEIEGDSMLNDGTWSYSELEDK